MLGESLEENEVAENDLAEKINADSAMSDAQLGNEFEIENEKHEETNNSGEEGANKGLTVDYDGANMTNSEMRGDDMVDLYQMGSEDDEEDDLWEDDSDDEDNSEEDDEEETAINGDEVSEEEGTEGEHDEENSEGDDEEMAIDNTKVSEQEAIKEKEDDDEEEEKKAGVEKEIAKAGKWESEQRIVKKVEANPKKVKTSNERKEKNHVTEESSKKQVSKEKPKSSKRKGKKRVESMGMIFMCSSKTKNDCFQYKVLGLPESKKDIVEQIYPGMRLFLYDVDLRLMYGIYKAHGHGGYNIEPSAFKSKFPSQVRFNILANCLPLAEEKFKKVIKENYFTNKKFDCKLNAEQVKKLCKLFQHTNKGNTPKKLPWSRKAEEPQLLILGDGSRKRRGVDRRRPVLKEKIWYVERPRKRLRKAISREPFPRQLRPSPRPPSVPIVVLDRNSDVVPHRQDVYVESRDRYRDSYRPDLYESMRGRPIERSDPYQKERDQHLERRDSYLELDPYLVQRDRVTYRDERDPYFDCRAPYADARDSYPDRRIRIRYRDPDPYPDTRDRRDTYMDERDLYTQGRVYKNVPITESYGFYRRDIVSDNRDVYREDRGVAYHDPYKVGEALDRSLSLERRRYNVVTQDPYVYRTPPSTTEHLYSAAYPSRSGLTREYHL